MAVSLGGAIGDALGAPVEFMRLSEIREIFGPEGVWGYWPRAALPGAFTDHTQMTLFTAEGLIEDCSRNQVPSDQSKPDRALAVLADSYR